MSGGEGRWKVVAASARGAQHAAVGEPCDDAHTYHRAGPWLVATVCDGAGSAARGGEGARISSHTIVRELAGAIGELRAGGESDSAALLDPVRDALVAARRALERRVEGGALALADFDTTVVGAVVGAEGGLLFHVGDGVGIGIEGDAWASPRISPPENGEFAEETFFLTRCDWEAHLRFTPLPAAVDLVALMSDGAVPFAMARRLAGVEPAFFAPVTRYLDRVDVETGARALFETLEDPRTRAITADDKTLLWARRGRA